MEEQCLKLGHDCFYSYDFQFLVPFDPYIVWGISLSLINNEKPTKLNNSDQIKKEYKGTCTPKLRMWLCVVLFILCFTFTFTHNHTECDVTFNWAQADVDSMWRNFIPNLAVVIINYKYGTVDFFCGSKTF